MRRVPNYLHRRSGVYYFKRHVPLEAREAFGGKEQVWGSLRTSNLAEARHRLTRELRAFDQKVARATGGPDPTLSSNLPSVEPTRSDIEAGARAWLKERLDRNDPVAQGRHPGKDEKEERQADLGLYADHVGRSLNRGAPELLTRWTAEAVCRRYGWSMAPGSPADEYLLKVIGRAELEFAHQGSAHLDLDPVEARDRVLFAAEKFVSDPVRQTKPSMALGAAVERFLANPSLRADEKTLKQYRQRLGTMVESLGQRRSVASITKEDCRRLRDEVLMRLPKNRAQRYPGMTVEEAIGAAERAGSQKLKTKSILLMVDNLRAFFEWAVKEDICTDNPARVISMPASGQDSLERQPFNPDQLQIIFRAPLFGGCVDDERNYGRPGPNHPRRERYWLPLLGLFSGMRLNEMCQLKVGDLTARDGVRYFDLRRFRADGRKLKNVSSARPVPLHDELIRLGFLDYVASLDAAGWLFPLLDRTGGAGGSDAISKWFGRFLGKCGLGQPELVFHSFRHTFRDGMREAGVDQERSHALGGWKDGSVGASYGGGFKIADLAKAMNLLGYPGLDLSHLQSG